MLFRHPTFRKKRSLPTILFIFSVLLTGAINSFSQSTADVNTDAVIANVRKQLVAMSEAEGELSKFAIKNHITGDFVVDLTIVGKGKIATVFMVSSNAESVPEQNQLKSKLMTLEFDDVKIPKKERIKFRHTFTF